jgi:nucleoside-diphosphate-sugar epimerase
MLERLAVGKRMRERMQRLTRSLEADASATMGTLGWQPRRSLAEALDGLVRGSAP